MKKSFKFHKYFGSEILERGLKYYREGRVHDILVDENISKATVKGSSNYRVSLDLKNKSFKCNCPYGGNCKHMVAVFYALQNNSEVLTMSNLMEKLEAMDRSKLIGLIRKLVLANPKLSRHIYIYSSCKADGDIKGPITNLSLYDENEETYDGTAAEEISELIKSSAQNRLELFSALFEKLFSFYEGIGGDESMEDLMFEVLEEISKETKRLDKAERKRVLINIMRRTKDYDFFWDSIDDTGLKIDYNKLQD